MTYKERAKKYRQIAELLLDCGYCKTAKVWANSADELDPPEPEISDGTLCVITYYSGNTAVGYKRANTLRSHSNFSIGNTVCYIQHDSDIQPVRILAPGQVAVDRCDLENAIYTLRAHGQPADAKLLKNALDRELDHSKEVNYEVG